MKLVLLVFAIAASAYSQDLNGDGKVDSADLQISVDQVLARLPCTSADLDVNKTCDVRDAALLIKAMSSIPQQTTLEISSFLGGNDFEHSRDVAVDSAGNFYVVGGTQSANFRSTTIIRNSGTPESTSLQEMDVFVMKFGPKGNLIWSTIIGGPNCERAYAVEVDSAGYVYGAGRAGRNAPTTAGAFQTTFMGGLETPMYGNQDGYVFKLSPDGTRLVWASYLGSTDPQPIRDIAVDSAGNVYAGMISKAGSTYTAPVAAAFLNARLGSGDTAIFKIAADGTNLLWARYFGGSGDEGGSAPSIRVDAQDQPYFLTLVGSTNAFTSPTAYSRVLKGDKDYYLAKLSPAGSVLFATYLGGSLADTLETHNLALDAAGNAYIGGGTCSTNFPTTLGAFDRTHNGNGGSTTGANSNYRCDGVVAKISSDGSKLLASTFLGGQYGDAVEGIAVDNTGIVHVTGSTFSPNFPTTSDAFRRTHTGIKDLFYTRLLSDLSKVEYSTYLGAERASGRGITVDASGGAYLVGETNSAIFPTVNAFQPAYGGGNTDAILILFRTR